MHLDVERLQRFLDHELKGSEATAAREHLAECADCRRRLAEAEQAESEVAAQLQQLDHDVPRISAAQIVARARGSGSRPLRWAAGVVLALGIAGAAYAAPGSPLPRWVRAALTWAREGGGGGGGAAPAVSGIAVVPGQALIISFASPQPGAEVRVTFTDGPEVVVRAPPGAATFTSDVERLVIHNRGDTASVLFEIAIPRGAARVEIRVQDQRRFLKEGSAITGPTRFPLAP